MQAGLLSVEGQGELACSWRAVLGQAMKELATGKSSRIKLQICSHFEAESIVFQPGLDEIRARSSRGGKCLSVIQMCDLFA